MSQCAFNSVIGTAPYILWQNILDTKKYVSYTAYNQKKVLINSITGDYYVDHEGLDGHAWELKFQPVILFTVYDLDNILRLSMPYQLAGRGEEGLNDVTFFNPVKFNTTRGRWGGMRKWLFVPCHLPHSI